MTEVQEGQPRRRGPNNTNADSRYAFAGTHPYAALTGEPPKLQFGEHGELTYKTLDQAGLTGEERKRAVEMLKVQKAYIEIYNCLDFPNDPDGHVVDLSGIHMTQPKVAIAWTLALLGFRRSGKPYIKKRGYQTGGVYENSYYYVDSRAPDQAEQELRPEHSADDHWLPPDTRRLAAIRDEAPGQELPQWNQKPVVTVEHVPRANPETQPPADTMDAP